MQVNQSTDRRTCAHNTERFFFCFFFHMPLNKLVIPEYNSSPFRGRSVSGTSTTKHVLAGQSFFFFSFVSHSKFADLALGSDRMGAITQLLLAAMAYSNLPLAESHPLCRAPPGGPESAHWSPSGCEGGARLVV